MDLGETSILILALLASTGVNFKNVGRGIQDRVHNLSVVVFTQSKSKNEV